MKFVYPEFLYALFALLIPVIIHLFNFRRFKKINFSNVKFLEEVKLQTQSKSRLKHLLVLFSRMLALASLVLAFCLPYFPVENQKMDAGRKAISVYIDNSYSMNGENEKGHLLEQSKELARNIAKSYDESDRFQLLTNDFEGRHQRMVSREEFIEYVDEVQLTAKVKKISQATERMKEALHKEGVDNKRGFVLSDFQKSISDIASLQADSNHFFSLVPIQQLEVNNVYIDSIWFKSPVRQLNSNEELVVRIVNHSQREINNLSVKLRINNMQKALASIDIPPNSRAETSMFFTSDRPGIQQGVVEIKDHPITFDDRLYFSYDVSEKIKVMCIGDNNASVKSIFNDDPYYDYVEVSANGVDYSALKHTDLVVLDGLTTISSGLNQELKKFTENNGTIVLFPSSSLNISSYNEFLLNMNANRISTLSEKESVVSDINLENYFYDGVFVQVPKNIDLPVVKKHLVYNRHSQSREEVLLGLRNGDSFLSRYPVGNGQLYVFSVGTTSDMSNLSRHAIFVTSVLRIAELSQGSQELYQVIGEDQAVKVETNTLGADEVFHIINEATQFDVIPSYQNNGGGMEVFVHEQIDKAGNYYLSLGDENITGLAFNYSRKESDLTFYDPASLQEEVQQSSLFNYKIIESVDGAQLSLEGIAEGTKLWKWFVLLALLFLLMEVLFLRYL